MWMRCFVIVQVFVVNMDSYLGRIVHTYFLYEENGLLQILPRDYNLAFATYSLGMPDPINNATLYVNYPIHTPTEGEVMLNRPLYHNLMKNSTYFAKYRAYFDQLISGYFENGYFKDFVTKACTMIAPYVERDATAFSENVCIQLLRKCAEDHKTKQGVNGTACRQVFQLPGA